MNKLVIDRRLAAISLFQPTLDRECVWCGQRDEGKTGQLGLGLFPRATTARISSRFAGTAELMLRTLVRSTDISG